MLLKQLRSKIGVEQKDIAEYLGVTNSAYGHYEKGRREPSLDVLVKLSKYFNVSIDYLITGKQTDREAPQSRIEQIFDSLSPTAQSYILEAAEGIYRLEHGTSFVAKEDIKRQSD